LYNLSTSWGVLQRLFQYFNGANKDEKKFNLTTPVVTAFIPENNFTSASQNFSVSFYLPDKYQVGFPPLLNSSLYV
jgi:SOUL heme-binding protein